MQSEYVESVMGKEEMRINEVSVSNPADCIELEAKEGTLVSFDVGRKVWVEVEVFTQTLMGKPGEALEKNLVVRISVIPGITHISYPQQGLRKALVDTSISDETRGPFPKDLL